MYAPSTPHLRPMYAPSMPHLCLVPPPQTKLPQPGQNRFPRENLSESAKNAKNPPNPAENLQKIFKTANFPTGDSIVRKDHPEEGSFGGFATWTHLGF